MSPVGLANTRISTGYYAQKSSRIPITWGEGKLFSSIYISILQYIARAIKKRGQ